MPPSSTLASPPLLHPLHDSRSAVPVLDSAGSLPHNALVGSRKIWVYEQIPKSHPIKLVHAGTQGLPRWFSGMAHGGTVTHLSNKIISQLCNSAEKNTTCNGKEGDCSKIIAFSPLEFGGESFKRTKKWIGE
ncbi:uncharacterized protein LOC103707985 isoform X2 [Phoenix dactylifera]|uniref:Uncharacterized protein LOC103707985 isoform X2 n=1 Tax=Phoenix dactylifera TaxID=42345 RepID=A0A8B7MV17_PHODC|nr:uncharacterized protein LOC103707985 isoform X2 [Phoenix dactylifera]